MAAKNHAVEGRADERLLVLGLALIQVGLGQLHGSARHLDVLRARFRVDQLEVLERFFVAGLRHLVLVLVVFRLFPGDDALFIKVLAALPSRRRRCSRWSRFHARRLELHRVPAGGRR